MENQIQKSENADEKQINKPWLFKPGQSGNPKGKLKGTLNSSTIFEKAAKEVAKALKLGKKQDAVEMEIVKRVIKKALEGDLGACKDFLDRRYGKARESIHMQADINENIAVIVDDVKRKEVFIITEHSE